MKLIKGKKRCKCKACGAYICSNDYKYKASEGYYCFYHGRVASLHNGFMAWLKGVLNAKV